MAKIFSPPAGLEKPKIDFSNMAQYDKECAEYEEKLKKTLQEYNPDGENVGETISFPAADGYANYMIASMKPLQLVHIPLGDAWHFEYANRLTANDVREKLRQKKAIAEIFSKKGE